MLLALCTSSKLKTLSAVSVCVCVCLLYSDTAGYKLNTYALSDTNNKSLIFWKQMRSRYIAYEDVTSEKAIMIISLPRSVVYGTLGGTKLLG